MVCAGEGLGPYNKLMAQVCVSLDEYVADQAKGDPARALEALAELGMTETAALLGGTRPARDPLWQSVPFPYSQPRTGAS